MNKSKVLFLCTGNSARSQMAEAFLRKYGGNEYEAHSAGLEPQDLHPLTKKVLEEAGLDISGQRAKSVREYLGKVNFAYLITVCDQADKNCPTTFPGISQRLHWSFEDPAAFSGSEEQKLEKFRDIRDQIEAKVREWLSEQEAAQR